MFAKSYRLTVGLMLSYVYLLIFTGTVDWFGNFNKMQKVIFDPNGMTLTRAGSGLFFIYCMAIISVYLIIFAHEYHKIFMGYYLGGCPRTKDRLQIPQTS